MSTDAVLLEITGAVLVATINRPAAFNALNAEVLTGLRQAVNEASADPKLRAVVLTGSGDRAFCAGADLKELAGLSSQAASIKMRAGQTVLRDIERAPIPVISAVNGLALGGGLELALATTFPIVSERASFGLPESGLGLIPGYGGTQRLPRSLTPQVAAHMMLTGSRLDAARAYELGLTPVAPVAPGELLATAVEIAAKVAAQGPTAVRSILTAIVDGRDAPLDAALQLETALAALAVGGSESDEGIGAFLERRPPHFADHQEET